MEVHIIVTKVLSAILVDSRVIIFILILLFERSTCNTLRKQRLNPFQIKSIEHGSYFKGNDLHILYFFQSISV